jgi:Protein of unknown function (DUF4245)
MQETVEAPKRQSRTGRDMALSLIVLLIPLALIVGIFRLRGGEDVVVVDPSAAIGQARASELFPVAAPEGLGSEWRPISANFSAENGTGVLRVGYLTPDDGTVQLLETNEDPQALLPREFGPDGEPTGTVDVDGTVWRSYRVRGGEQALVLTTSDRTIVVQGRASAQELRDLAAAVS